MTRTTTEIDVTATDGLSPVQRALLRTVLRASTPVRCSNVVEGLLDASGCPPNVNWEVVDAVMLTLAHPVLCTRPVLEYVGNPGSRDGWLPGAYYRMVLATDTLRGLVAAGQDAPSWDPAPLELRVPFALLFGCASWELETDTGCPPERHAQATVRLRCAAVRCLGCDYYSVMTAMNAYRDSGQLEPCLTRIGPGGPPIGCYGHDLQSVIELLLKGASVGQAGYLERRQAVLPHGTLMGVRVEGGQEGEPLRIYFLSLPSLTVTWAGEGKSPGLALILHQPACGRHIGQEARKLRSVAGCRIRAGRCVVVECVESLDTGKLVHAVPVEPLALDAYRTMLHGDSA